MSDYKKLVEALRICSGFVEKPSCTKCAYSHKTKCKWDMMQDAADAIEALQAEVEKWQDIAYQDSLKQGKMQERIWELEALKEAHIKPSYGEWLTVQINPLDRMHNPIYECTCSRCHEEYTLAKIPNYCPNCGAKMEVQE